MKVKEIKTQEKSIYVGSPLNYTGGKFKLLPQILPMIPAKISTFVDMFSGGGVVAANIDAEKTIINDLQNEVVSVIRAMVESDTEGFINDVKEVQNSFGVTKSNKDGYLALRKFYNAGNRNPEVFFGMVSASFSNQIRFNKKGNFNMPSGVRKDQSNIDGDSKNQNLMLNPKQESKMRTFSSALKEKRITFSSVDFIDFDIEQLDRNSFVYLDPPYLITDATYNKLWTLEHEQKLYALMDRLTEKGIKFALSNVLKHKGFENKTLINWAKNYNVNYLNVSYGNASYQRKERKSPSVEVLITNYDTTTFEMINSIAVIKPKERKLKVLKTKVDVIASPLNYTGNKRKAMPQVKPLLPNDISTFVDLCAGSCVMAANINAQKYVVNDLFADVLGLVKHIIDSDSNELIAKTNQITAEFNVNNKKQSKHNFLKMLEYYNTTNREPHVLLALISSSFRNQMRFSDEKYINGNECVNSSYESAGKKLSLSWGTRFFNPSQAKNLIKFANVMREKNIEYHSTDFTLVDLDGLDKNSLVYFDPPYYLSDTGYNKSWSDYHEQRLMDYIDSLNARGIRFALSNFFENSGFTHTKLIEWSKKYNVHYLDMCYKNASHQKKDKTSPTVEVLITNYDPVTFEINQLAMVA